VTILFFRCISAIFIFFILTGSQNVFAGDVDIRSYENATLTEDVTWHGTVLITGGVVIAPQATLRIEPGTVVRFVRTGEGGRKARLVVMGRIQSIGSAEHQILFTADAPAPVKGDWGGILLLATEKRNQFEHTAIEGAETGIEARISAFTARSLRVSVARTGMALHDSVVSVDASGFSACETGVAVSGGEFELRGSNVSTNRSGMRLSRSSVALSSVSVTDNSRQGILSEECRLRISSCTVSSNGSGAEITGGEGILFMTRFTGNRDTALHLGAAHLKVNRSLFEGNDHDAVRVEDDKSTVWGCVFRGNGGYNLYNAGHEEVVVVQNWWGSTDEKTIAAKIFTSPRDSHGSVQFVPWLSSQPAILP